MRAGARTSPRAGGRSTPQSDAGSDHERRPRGQGAAAAHYAAAMRWLVVGAALLAQFAAAQVQIRVFAHTDLVVMDQRIPRDTDISGSAALSWSSRPLSPASAHMTVTVGQSSVVFEDAISSVLPNPPTIAPHKIRVELTSSVPLNGTLRFEATESGGSGYGVDVRNDGSSELTNAPPSAHPGVYEETLTVTLAGVVVVVTTWAGPPFVGGPYTGHSHTRLSSCRTRPSSPARARPAVST